MVMGDPARGGKGHVTGPSLDTNVNSMTTRNMETQCTIGKALRIQDRYYSKFGSAAYSWGWETSPLFFRDADESGALDVFS
ncbi:unnamed protein product [Tetraodon nigroviridis]|uniref:(spotted green pufferfish) hypothetical protein n=1 Tax=Tetraodon nigroviridis TaxID=99883 RepID=Q4RUM9_TETNG|nr:unnamed protein product [Tetraodon nigroviridis]